MKHSSQYKVLAVAPYEGMKYLLEQLNGEFPNLSLDIFVGNLESGVEVARSATPDNYDIVLSRGGTASLLQLTTDIPVVEIPVSTFDILRAIHLSNDIKGKKAIVAYSSITKNASLLNELMDLGIDIYTLNAPSDLPSILDRLVFEHYTTVLCDVISSDKAIQAGLSPILITSGEESIREALQAAEHTLNSRSRLVEENHFLKTLVMEQPGDTVVFNEDATLYFTTLSKDDNAVIEVLKNSLEDVLNGETGSFWKSIGGYLYSIKASEITVPMKRVIFYLSRSRVSNSANRWGIVYKTRSETERQYVSSLYRITGDINALKPTIKSILETHSPVTITGEDGTGRSHVAAYLCINSGKFNHSLITIECRFLNEKSINFLINNHRSPLFHSGNTLLFNDLEEMDPSTLQTIGYILTHTACAENNLILFSSLPNAHATRKDIQELKNRLRCVDIPLRPLRKMKEKIPALANLFLTQLNTQSSTNILRFDNAALQTLREYEWPGNYGQFTRIIAELVTSSQNHIIHEADVKRLLAKENKQIESDKPNPSYTIDITGSLDDIIRRIIRITLEENNGNQAAAARSLNIGRTTLWRYLKENE